MIWALLVAVAVGTGLLVLRLLSIKNCTFLEQFVLGLACGLGVLSFGSAALGGVGLLTRSWMLLWLLVAAACAAASYWAAAKGRKAEATPAPLPPWPRKSKILWTLYALVAAFGVVYFLSCLAPPIDGDTLHSYLHVPRQFVDAARIINLPYEVHANVPLNIQMLSAMALLVSGDELAQLVAGFTMLAGCCLILLVLGRRYLNVHAGLLASLLFASMICVSSLAPTAKVNLGWAFFELASLYCLARWWSGEQLRSWLLLAGLLAGLALGTLYAAAFTILAVCFFLSWLSFRKGPRGLISDLLCYCVPAFALALPWLLRNYLDVGNPVYPVGNAFLGLPSAMPVAHTTSVWGWLTIAWDMSVGYVAGKFGKPVGPWVLAPLPALLLLRPLPQFLRFSLGLGLVIFVLWLFGVQRPRNLLPALGLFSLGSAWAILKINLPWKWMKKGVLALLLLFLIFSLSVTVRAHLAQPHRLAYIAGKISRQQMAGMMQDRFLACPNSVLTQYINNKLPPGAKVAALYLGNGYYINKPFWDSRMLDKDFAHDRAKGWKEMSENWRRAGITHVFVNWPYLAKIDFAAEKEMSLDYGHLLNKEFSSKCLRPLIISGGQELFEFTCR